MVFAFNDDENKIMEILFFYDAFVLCRLINLAFPFMFLFCSPLKSPKSHPGRLTHFQLGSHLFVYLFFSPVIIKIQENTVKGFFFLKEPKKKTFTIFKIKIKQNKP